jgi:predicted nucleic acid-binding protein
LSIVVSDTSPIRVLSHLGLLELLHDLFEEVFIPPAVIAELSRQTVSFSPILLSGYSFFQIRTVKNQSLVKQFLSTLDAGESEALVLALEIQADTVLIDELDGREMAMQMGLKPLGVLGVLVRAKKNGLIGLIKPLMDQLQTEIGFFISAKLYAEILRLSGE